MPFRPFPIRLSAVLSKLLAGLALATALGGGAAHAAPPRFDAASQRLILPLVKVGDSVYAGVEIELDKGGAWKVVKAGGARSLQDGETPDAEVDSAGNTLTVARVHIGGKVYNNVELDIGGGSWSLKGAPQAMSALTEDDFLNDDQLEATLDNVVLLNLESSGASADASDSGGSGTDSFPLRLQAGDYQFCFDKLDDGAATLNLRDEQGNLLLTLKSGDPCAKLSLAAGRYVSEVSNGAVSAGTRSLLRYSVPGGSENGGSWNGGMRPLFMHRQQPGGQAFAFDFGNAFIVAFGANCTGCDLSDGLYALFPGWGRNLSNSKMDRIRFPFAQLTGADLSNTSMVGAQITNANLSGATLAGANLRDALIENTDLRGANLGGANLRGARLTNVNLLGANLAGATWTDGRWCSDEYGRSMGKCD